MHLLALTRIGLLPSAFLSLAAEYLNTPDLILEMSFIQALT